MDVRKQLWQHWLGKVVLSKLLALLLIYCYLEATKQQGWNKLWVESARTKDEDTLVQQGFRSLSLHLCSGTGPLWDSLLSCKPGGSCHLSKSISRTLASYILFHDEVNALCWSNAMKTPTLNSSHLNVGTSICRQIFLGEQFCPPGTRNILRRCFLLSALTIKAVPSE